MKATGRAPGRLPSGERAGFLTPEQVELLGTIIRESGPGVSMSAIAREFGRRSGRTISLPTIRQRAARIGVAFHFKIDPATRSRLDAAIRDHPGLPARAIASAIRRPNGVPLSVDYVRRARQAANPVPARPAARPLTPREDGILRALLIEPGKTTLAATAAKFQAATGRTIGVNALRERAKRAGWVFQKGFTPDQREALDRIVRGAGPGDSAHDLATRFREATGRNVSADHVRVRRHKLGCPYVKLDGSRIRG